MSKQNKIGRPPGSSRLNPEDDLHLHRVADRMILDSSLKLTPAMVAVGIDSETVITYFAVVDVQVFLLALVSKGQRADIS